MTSEKQKNANKSNAKKSTGPKSETGKAVSRLNAYKHGLTAQSVVIGNEDPTEFESLRERLASQFKPDCELSRALVDQLATQFCRLRRVPLLEAAIFEALSYDIRQKLPFFDEDIEEARYQVLRDKIMPFLTRQAAAELNRKADEIAAKQNRTRKEPLLPDPRTTIGRALIEDAKQHDTLGKLARYEVRLTNGILKTLKMLRQLELQRATADSAMQ